MRSIGRRVSVWTAVGVLAIFAAASVLWYRSTEHALVALFDRGLQARLTTLAALVEPADEGASPIEFDLTSDVSADYRRGPRAAYFDLRLPPSTLIARSESLGDGDLPRPIGTIAEPRYEELTLPDGRRGRACGARWTVRPRPDDEEHEQQVARLGDGLPVELVVAVDRADLDAALHALLLSIGAVALVMAAGAAALVTWIVPRGLEPLRALGREVAALDPRALPEQLAVRDVPLEIRPVVDRMNDLLGRVREAFERERRTTAAIAHELKTPIAELRSLTDVALKWPDDDEYGRRTVAEANGIALQMGRLADTVLRLAQAESGELAPVAEPFDVRDELDAVLGTFRRRAAEREIELRHDVVGPTDAHSDREMVRIAFANLIANAVEHGPPGTTVRCATTGEGDHVRVTVRNPANGLDAHDLVRLTERFWRKDAARSGRDHAGLGLALTRELCDRLGAELAFALDDGELVASVTVARAR